MKFDEIDRQNDYMDLLPTVFKNIKTGLILEGY